MQERRGVFSQSFADDLTQANFAGVGIVPEEGKGFRVEEVHRKPVWNRLTDRR
jgi:hypothetical protein